MPSFFWVFLLRNKNRSLYQKHHTKGIILGSKNDGDDSKRVAIFTENFGLINAKIQGARTVKSKLRFGAQDFSLGEFSLVHGRAGWKVVSAKSEKNIFESLRYSKEKLKAAGNVLNLIKKLSGEEEAHSIIFEIISNFLVFLSESPKEMVILAECLTLIRILHSLGYLRHDPDFSAPLSSSVINTSELELIAPHRSKMITLINESLHATQIRI